MTAALVAGTVPPRAGRRPPAGPRTPLWVCCRAAVLLLPLGGIPVPGLPVSVVIMIFAVPGAMAAAPAPGVRSAASASTRPRISAPWAMAAPW